GSWSSASLCGSRLTDRAIDRRVAGAAADVPGEPGADLFQRRILRERGRGQDHPGRTDPALGAALHDERLLKGIVDQTFDRGDSRAFYLSERNEAGIHGSAVHEHRARAALSLSAPLLRPGQRAVFPKNVEEPLHRRRLNVAVFPVEREPHAAGFPGGACLTRSGITGISRTSSPRLRIALTTAGAGPSMGISPTPFAPKGPCSYGFSRMVTSISGVS